MTEIQQGSEPRSFPSGQPTSSEAPRRLLIPRGNNAESQDSLPSGPSDVSPHLVKGRFGNDFMRNGVVLFRPSNVALEIVCKVLFRRDFVHRNGPVPFVLTAVRHPSTKLIIKFFKVHNDAFLIDVRVSSQCGFGALEDAFEVLHDLEIESLKYRPASHT